MQWAVCAVVPNSTLSEQPTSPRSLKASANLRGNTAVSAATNANSTAGSIVAHRSDGYPCGLWFLFHYMTGKSHCVLVLLNVILYRLSLGCLELTLPCSRLTVPLSIFSISGERGRAVPVQVRGGRGAAQHL